jgi:RNA polymerase sigma-70 factor (ECF subfamily)
MPEDLAAVMRQLHDEHAAALWAFCLHLTNDRAHAEDVAQETLLRAWRNAAVLEESRGSVRSWLFTVARNIVIDEWRTKRTRKEILTDDLGELSSTEDRTDELLLSWVVAEALTQLSP